MSCHSRSLVVELGLIQLPLHDKYHLDDYGPYYNQALLP
jgi:hypothetical protein